jgi:CheY-like chemotaxis protein
MLPAASIILYAEDNENDFVLLKYALTTIRAPVELVFVSSGQAAIDYLNEKPPPAIILLDHMLPGLSGLDVLQWLRTTYPELQTPVMILTASNREVDEQRAAALGATQYFAKPATFDGYVRLAREITGILTAQA